MTLAVRRSIASVGAATLLLSGAAALAASHASAATTPPWESGTAKDVNEVGTLALFTSTGTQITSGSTTTAPIAAFVVGSKADASHTKATLFAYTPKSGVSASKWSGEQLSSSTTYPVTAAGAPADVKGASGPVVTGGSSDESIASYIADFPNNGTATGYTNAYQLRVKTSADGGTADSTYQSLDIVVSGTTWVETFPSSHPLKATSTALSVSAKGKVKEGKPVTLKATESITGGGHAPGTVQFASNGKKVGQAVKVSAAGEAAVKTTSLLPGKDSITATFTPTQAATFASSVSKPHAITVVKVALANKAKPKLTSHNAKHVAKAGTKEFVSKGKWSPTATSFRYQWFLGSKKIKHATKSSLKLKASEVGKKLSCVVTARRAHFTNATARTKRVTVRA
jgi:Bacterial Ig-like domain (group 3)